MGHQVLIRDLDKRTLDNLKARAEANRRSLQSELKQILVDAARPTVDPKLLAEIDALRKSLKGRIHTDSVKLLREDRKR
jgi:plasmid stability protein